MVKAYHIARGQVAAVLDEADGVVALGHDAFSEEDPLGNSELPVAPRVKPGVQLISEEVMVHERLGELVRDERSYDRLEEGRIFPLQTGSARDLGELGVFLSFCSLVSSGIDHKAKLGQFGSGWSVLYSA